MSFFLGTLAIVGWLFFPRLAFSIAIFGWITVAHPEFIPSGVQGLLFGLSMAGGFSLDACQLVLNITKKS